jgi:hypothetical protein
MRLQVQKEPNCLVYSVAMLLDEPAEKLFEEIGHHGHEIIWSALPPPKCYKGININEVQDCVLRRGYGLVPIDKCPMNIPYDDVKYAYPTWQLPYNLARFYGYLEKYPALLVMDNHACAWDLDTQKVFDPNGFITSLQSYQIESIWLLI